MAGRDNEITFRIVKSYGTIQKYETGWSKEVNLVSWNEGPAKFDIRDWDPNHEHMSKGITLHPDEMKKLLEIAKTIDFDRSSAVKSEPDMER